MDIHTLKELVVKEYDNRHLKSDVRYKALDKIIDFLKKNYGSSTNCFSIEKQKLKHEYERYKGKDLSGAESSAFNELYNQFASLVDRPISM